MLASCTVRRPLVRSENRSTWCSLSLGAKKPMTFLRSGRSGMGISMAATLGLDSRPGLIALSDSVISTTMLSPWVSVWSSDQRWNTR